MRSMCVAAAVILLPLPAGAQTVVTSFSEVPAVVKAGDTVDVTDAKGRTLRGRIGELSRSSIALTARRRASDGSEPFVSIGRFSVADVRQIRLQRRDSPLNGTLIGHWTWHRRISRSRYFLQSQLRGRRNLRHVREFSRHPWWRRRRCRTGRRCGARGTAAGLLQRVD